MAYFNSTIPVANLQAPQGARPAQYLYDEEDQLYAAYKARLDVARVLGQAQKYFDGIHYLNISSECFLKYAFCLVRHEIRQINPPKDILHEKAPYDFDTTFLFPKNKLTTQYFGHDLNLVVRFLIKFSDAYNFPEFKSYILHLKSGEKWINTRYIAGVHATFQQDFNDYLRDFDAVLNGCFRGIQ